MSRPLTNLTLGAAVGLSLLTGTLAFAVGTPVLGWTLAVVHGIAGLVLVVLAVRKLGIVRTGWRRERPSRWASIALAVAAVTTVLSGVAQSLGWRDLGLVSAIQVHVPAGIAATVGVIWHMLIHPGPVRQARAGSTEVTGRRATVRLLGVSTAAAATWFGLEAAAWARRGFAGRRRFTGSARLERPLVTQWFTDGVQRVDPTGWRLLLVDSDGPRALRLAELHDHPARRTVEAVLDCTGGWYSTVEWSGVPLSALLVADSETESILVRSTTGYQRRLPLADLDTLLLATHMDGAELRSGHGYPARLVAPGRRGFWWVKWVQEIAVEDVSWLRQPPFPLR